MDADGGAVAVLTRLLGKMPVAPAMLVYTRPGTLALTIPGFNDRTTVQQAAADAAQALQDAVPAPTTPSAPAVTATSQASA